MSSSISWDDQRIFLAVLETGSLSAAARRLGLSHPTVRTRIEALEHALGAVLFTRSVNGLTPTETAEALRETARTMALASDLFVRQASAPHGEIAGTVRISVPEMMGVEVVPPMLRTLREKHPRLRVELSLSNAQADILAHEVDLAVRTVAPRQGALVARKVAAIPIGLFASPDYIARRGMPETLNDLAEHDLIGPDRSRSDITIAEGLGPQFSLDRFVLRTDSHPAQVAAARAGVGIAVCQVPLGEADLRLVRVIPDFSIHLLDTWVVTHENLSRVPRIRAVFDHLVTAFGEIRTGRGAPAA
ncbi:LysR family transcriptional regulator [Pelagibacterium sp. H642]|uniref:LysR family transcriptional regulator n=1 Tax=Pelagibacterium sp. H642 TaxID=1881069 RepID=UPI002815DB72|nr:LysR family transcriptional regulator [Pelagibacterium sp. H642]WMT90949.1 LysR family transcriptional regulator [Pelagibacterium sp. H642]